MLEEYNKKRDFKNTPEPKGSKGKDPNKNRFVVQRHQARNLHYDLRLEIGGVLKSWAVPKGPSMNPAEKRLAIHTEDHPMKYLTFEGTIPKGNYGAGKMAIWDTGTFSLIAETNKNGLEQLEAGELKLNFQGDKLRGDFTLVKTGAGSKKDQWLLIKKKDAFAVADPFEADMHLNDDISTSSRQKYKPMLATLVKEAFNDKNWIFEIKWDGYRMISELQKGKINLYSRNGLSFNLKFANLLNSLKSIPYDAVLDGEVVLLDEEGNPDFHKLKNYNPTSSEEIRYYVFDILELNGIETGELPLKDRKSLIEEVVEGIEGVFYCDHIENLGVSFFEQVTAMGLEGVIAKQMDSTYSQGMRSEKWLKIKATQTTEAVICGYTDSEGSTFGSLVLGQWKLGELVYIGNVGTGFSSRQQKEILNALEPFHKKATPFSQKINLKGRKPNWVEPKLYCSVKFAEWTNNDMLRHPVFKSMWLPEDQGKPEVTTEKTVESKVGEPSINREGFLEVDGFQVPVSNLEKIYWPDSGINKYQLLDYYIQVAPFILPYLKDRPQSLHRHPNGITGDAFYQKDTANMFPDWIATESVYSSSSEKTIEYLLCQNEASLIYMANLGCIEINPWHSRVGSLDQPDYCVIDLDPSPKNTFDEIIEVALFFKEILDTIKVPSYCKTSGSKGLHIYLPLDSGYTYEEGRTFVKLICHMVQEKSPQLTTLTRNIKSRGNRIYLDYLQNRQGQTLAAPYCVRPKPEAPVSTPLTWEEVRAGLKIADFTIFNVPERLKSLNDLFRPLLTEKIKIENALSRLEDLD